MRNSLWVLIALIPATALARDNSPPTSITLANDAVIETEVNGVPARLRIGVGAVNTLLLNASFVDRAGIKPAPIFGTASLNVGGRRELRGNNAVVKSTVAMLAFKTRAIWFRDVPPLADDGRLGPGSLPQDSVTLTLGGAGGAPLTVPMFGGYGSTNIFPYREPEFAMAVEFDTREDLPLATAAAGAAIAAKYDGKLIGETIDVPIAMGISRPARRLQLARPMTIGPFTFSELLVRTRTARDSGGVGAPIADGSETDDPAEIVVTATNGKGPRPAFGITLGRRALAACASITFDKRARTMTLRCAVAPS